jgi:L-lactate utilization protein LutC
MSTQVVLTLSDDLYEQAKQWAALTRRDVPQTLTDALEMVLKPLLEPPAGEPPVIAMSDAEVMALAQAQMPAQQGKHLDQLLAKQREDALTAPEQSELLALMQEYHRRWIRQSEALAEAVRRGIREPLAP